ncbi:MAG: phosphodiester glycosidase family protein [Pseudomonadota bacterium]
MLWQILISMFCATLGTCGAGEGCRQAEHGGERFTVCSYQTAHVRLAVHLEDDTGEPYGILRRLEENLPVPPLMVMNGGMYHDDLRAVGLHIEDGDQKKPLSTKDGWGNFHLLPNGVFWLDGNRVGVTETKAFAKTKRNVDFATQSGPMLVIDGKLHPRFLRNSDSRKIRNGVGVSDDGEQIHFAISQRAVTFWQFGQLFRQKLKTPNALFLDGSVSGLRAPNVRQESWRALGPMISVLPR